LTLSILYQTIVTIGKLNLYRHDAGEVRLVKRCRSALRAAGLQVKREARTRMKDAGGGVSTLRDSLAAAMVGGELSERHCEILEAAAVLSCTEK
jgi:hypothetical protein